MGTLRLLRLRSSGARAVAASEEDSMIETKLAFVVTAAGYGINILVLGIIAGVIWAISQFFKKAKANEERRG
jgi:Na+-transporting methylmalonyl-CoA/oxaloacetate decarboxylase gamma subunit